MGLEKIGDVEYPRLSSEQQLLVVYNNLIKFPKI